LLLRDKKAHHRREAFRGERHRPHARGFTRHGDYYESRDYVLSSAIGHLLELVRRGRRGQARKVVFAHLPVIPPHFDLKPIERTEDRLKLLVKLLSARTSRASSTPATPGARES